MDWFLQQEQARNQRATGQPRRLRRRLRARTDLHSSSGTDDSSLPRDIGLGLGLGLTDDNNDDEDEDPDLDAATRRLIEVTRRVHTRLRLASFPQRTAGTGEQSQSTAQASPRPNTDEDEQEQQVETTRGGNDLMTGGYNTL